MISYDPKNWYWIVARYGTQVFSSAGNVSVSLDDVTYKAWLSAGNKPTAIDSTDSLRAVLEAANVPPYAPVTNIQARLALRAAGLLDQAKAAVAGASPEVQDMWEYSATLRRYHPALLALAQQLNLTDTQLDQLFVAASQL